jgi:hypothetical protein
VAKCAGFCINAFVQEAVEGSMAAGGWIFGTPRFAMSGRIPGHRGRR